MVTKKNSNQVISVIAKYCKNQIIIDTSEYMHQTCMILILSALTTWALSFLALEVIFPEKNFVVANEQSLFAVQRLLAWRDR